MSKLDLGTSFILNSDIVIGQEIKTGGTFNGKPIYCKAINIGNATPSSPRVTYTHNIPIDKPIFVCGTITYNSSANIAIPWILKTDAMGGLQLNDINIIFDGYFSYACTDIIAICYYTKTTD